MRDLPTGLVTFLFTDIEGSTALVQKVGTAEYQRLLTEHSTLLRAAVEEADGREFGSEGDAHFFAFSSANGALRAAAEGQRALGGHPWPEGAEVRVRMGIHAGRPERHGDNYVGVDLNRVARIAAAGHGGQIIVSEPVQSAVSPDGGVEFRDLGRHRLKDIVEPEHLYQVVGPGLRDEFPPIRSIDTRPKRLPAQLTSFVGRSQELADVAGLVARERLVTLTGPGGSGKTRIAVAVADRLLPKFDDGVFFAPLAMIDDPELVPGAIASALELREAPDKTIREVVEEHLRDKALLLIADNFEHVITAAPVLAGLLEAAPKLSVLATSRELLRITGEREYAVPPLPVPALADDATTLEANPCIQLFANRAKAVRPDFRLTPENTLSVAEICRRLDGLPLAVELAAARTRILSPAELLTRLDSRLAELRSGARDAPERQRTLRATIDWSHDLLSGMEQRVFARLSVFAGGWTREAAEAICADDLGIDVLEGLESLVDKSLVSLMADGDDMSRFTMLETIREYAGERLEASGESGVVRDLHAAFFRSLAEAAEPHLTGPDSATWLARLAEELPNLRAALRWSIDAGDVTARETGLLTAGAIWRFWQLTGSIREAAQWFTELLAADGDDATLGRAKALQGSAGIAYWQHDLERSRQEYEEAVAIFRQLDDKPGLAAALNDLAYLPMLAGELPLARDLFGESLGLFRELGDTWQATLAEMNIANTSFFAGDYETARATYEALIPAIRERGDRFWLTEAVTGLGQLEQLTGRYDEARRYYAESLQLAVDAGTVPQVAMVLEPLSNVESAVGNHRRAVELWSAAQAIKERAGGGAPAEIMQQTDPRAAAVEAIGEAEAADAWETGQGLSLADAVALAMSPEKEATFHG